MGLRERKRKKSAILILSRIYELYGTEETFEEFLHNLCSENIIAAELLAKYIKHIKDVI